MKITQNYSLQFNIIFAGLSLMACAILLLVWYSYKNNSDAIMDLTEDLINQNNMTIAEKVTRYLIPASLMVELSSRLTGGEVKELSENTSLNAIMVEILRLYPQLSMFNIGNQSGSFLMQWRREDGSISTKLVDRQSTEMPEGRESRVTWIHRTPEGEIKETYEDPKDNYDPRVRPWYKGALDSEKKFWSGVYIFYTEKIPGITASYPVYDDQGVPQGVAALDIPLEELSAFMADQRIGKTGITFIINKKSELVAYPDPSVPVFSEGGVLRPRRVAEVENLAVTTSYQQYLVSQKQKFVFALDGKNYIASYSRLPTQLEQDNWIIGVVVPEEEMIGAIIKSNYLMLLISVAMVMGILLFSLILIQVKRALTIRTQFIRKAFGRYLSDEIVDTLLENPQGLSIGGDKREVTIMMTDLRGFTAISERLSAEQVVHLINTYMERMTPIIFKYGGTIDEIIGDALLVIFGAPMQRPDDPKLAVACALEMQLAMDGLNADNVRQGYPEIAMGIGLNTGDVVVGNIGSKRRTKYGVVGSNVNLTARIESYTVGGQIFASEKTLQRCEGLVTVLSQMQVVAKGVAEPINIYEIGGIAGEYNLNLPKPEPWQLVSLDTPVAISFLVLEGKDAGTQRHQGLLKALAQKGALIHTQAQCKVRDNLKVSLFAETGDLVSADLYAKIMQRSEETPGDLLIQYTSVPPEAEKYLHQLEPGAGLQAGASASQG
jgi:adenylate cyclase